MLWTSANAAIEFGIDPKTFARRARELGYEMPKGAAARKPWLTTKQVIGILVGDLERERIRETAAKADLLEMERAEMEGKTVTLDAVEKIFAERLQPVRSALVSAPTVLAAKVNPSDPPHALGVLNDWVDGVLAIGRGEQPTQ